MMNKIHPRVASTLKWRGLARGLVLPFAFLTSVFAAVQPNGSFSHQVEIKIPPGLGGMQPKLALVYNSRGENGILGQGWGIAGLQAITRIQNGQGINYNENDTFALTSFGTRAEQLQKLERIAFDEFRTHRESFSRFRAVCQWSSPLRCEPNSWEVTDPTGTV